MKILIAALLCSPFLALATPAYAQWWEPKRSHIHVPEYITVNIRNDCPYPVTYFFVNSTRGGLSYSGLQAGQYLSIQEERGGGVHLHWTNPFTGAPEDRQLGLSHTVIIYPASGQFPNNGAGGNYDVQIIQ